jgi:hypothetical protein
MVENNGKRFAKYVLKDKNEKIWTPTKRTQQKNV